MALPTTPLKVNFDHNEVTLDELCLFEPDGFSTVGFRAFLIAHTSWTRKEIGAVKVTELKDLAEQLAEKFKEISVPLA